MGISVKSNLLNLVAKGPSFSIEKKIADRYGLEASYSSGELNWGRYYKYNGILLRAKIYTQKIEGKAFIPFYGFYAGTLSKSIFREGYVDNTGFISIADRNFKANSIRVGGNVGFLFIPKKHFLLEATTGIGYGKYFNVINMTSKPVNGDYLDLQLWLSVGYRF